MKKNITRLVLTLAGALALALYIQAACYVLAPQACGPSGPVTAPPPSTQTGVATPGVINTVVDVGTSSPGLSS